MTITAGHKPFITYNEFPFRLFFVAFFLRLVELAFVRSSFVPDEYWQSLEVAHRHAFGYGFQTWEWNKGVRSYLYVSLITALFKLLAFLNIDAQTVVVLAPRVLQGLISALGDVYFLRWAAERRNNQYSWAALSWFTCTFISYCSTRTLSNVLEMNLTCIALYHYPWTPKTNSGVFSTLVMLIIFIRPTAAVTWAPLIIINLMSVSRPLTYVVKSYVPAGIVVGGLCVALDSFMYGRFELTPWNFFKYNIIKGISSFYGSHDYLWYFYVGVPIILGLQTAPFLIGMFNSAISVKNIKYNLDAQLLITIIWYLLVFSICPHKEVRFLLPILPMMLYLSSDVLRKWSMTAKTAYLYAVGIILLGFHVALFLFLGQFHQVGTLEAVNRLAPIASNISATEILYLAPCHTFPGYSHLHAPVRTRHLQCNPNLDNASDYVDEAEQFYNDSRAWLRREYSTTRPCTLPTHIVKFNTLNITNFLYINNYTLVDKIFHSYYYPQRTGDHVHIYRRKGPKCQP